MTLLTKILLILGAILTFGALSFIIYKEIDTSNRQLAIEAQVVQQKELADNILRSQNSYATKDDINQFIKDNGVNLKAIQDDMSKLHAEITAVNTLTVDSSSQHGTNLPSTNVGPNNPDPVIDTICKDGTPCPNTDLFGYQQKTQQLTLNEDFGDIKVPFGSVGFSAWQKNPWSIDITPREYHVTSVIGTDENQRTYFYNKFTVKVADKSYDVKIASADTKQEYPQAKWSFWNPRLFLNTGASATLLQSPLQGSANIGLTVGVISYGQFKTTPTFSLLQAGVAYQTGTKKASVVLNPFNVNIGKIFPAGLVDNTYIGPSVQMDTSGNTFIGVNLSVGF